MPDLGGSDGNGQGPDPLTVASTFVAAINAHNKWLYTSCIAPDASGDEITISELPGWVNRLAGDNYIAIALPRSATRFVFSTPPDPSHGVASVATEATPRGRRDTLWRSRSV